VAAIAEAHGGTVALTSVPGQGACFVVTLPAAPGTAHRD
jgi:signal transduction histidine kinase